MEKVSVTIITKNEEANIIRCLSSVSWADEKIVVDSGSTDKTVELAKEYGAKVVETDWPGWAKQKNRAIDEASNDWILSLDADEWLPEHAEEIIRKAISLQKYDAYTLSRKTFFLGKWIAHQGWYPDRQIRLFRKSATRFSEVPVHEKVNETSHTTDLQLDIWHESYTNLTQYFDKNIRYSKAQAEQQKNKKYPFLRMFLYPPLRFIQTYFAQLGFLDGWRGLQLSVLRSWYDFRVQKEILRLQRTSRQ